MDLPGPWQSGDKVELDIEIKAHLVFPRTEVADSAGRAAIMRGPLVYALESVDNPLNLHGCRVFSDTEFSEVSLPAELDSMLPGVAFEAEYRNSEEESPLYSSVAPKWKKGRFMAIPYYLWQNRGESDMRIFIPFV